MVGLCEVFKGIKLMKEPCSLFYIPVLNSGIKMVGNESPLILLVTLNRKTKLNLSDNDIYLFHKETTVLNNLITFGISLANMNAVDEGITD